MSKMQSGSSGSSADFPSSVGETWTNSVGMKFTYIPAGSFVMGSPANEKHRDPLEIQHRVVLTRPFLLGVHEVTQRQYRDVTGVNAKRFKVDDHPVERVSWDEAVAFCRTLSEREGLHYRLPTEAEWEYACRAGTTGPFWCGESLGPDDANCSSVLSEADGGKRAQRCVKVAVGSLRPNPWGLHDMHGNVAEWCADWYGRYPEGEVVDPRGVEVPVGNPRRVARGGSYICDASQCRSACRDAFAPSDQYYHLGFRVALDLPGQPRKAEAETAIPAPKTSQPEPIRLGFTGPPLSPETLKALELQLGAPLPEDYRQFLLERNGGAPDRKVFLLGPDPKHDKYWVDYFISIDDRLAGPDDYNPPNVLATLAYYNYGYAAVMPPEAMMIGVVCRDSLLLLYLRGPHRGEVHLVDPYVADDPTPEDIEKTRVFVASSFGEFLKMLRP